jgi:hypothetical protein
MSAKEAPLDDFELRQEIERAGTVVMERLYKLARAGYKPDFEMEFTGSIWLRHSSLRKRWPHDTLILYPNGLLVSASINTDEFRFELSEEANFERFLRMIPAPSFADKTRDFRSHILAWTFIIVWCAGFSIGASWLLQHITRTSG